MRNIDANCLVVYDIEKNDFIKKFNINPNKKNQKYIFIDDQGFCTFNLCRSRDVLFERVSNHADCCKHE